MVRDGLLRGVLAFAVAGVVVSVGALGTASAATAAPVTGQVYVVHGIAGVDLDVYVDNRNVCETAMTKMIVGPLRLSAGTHTVSMRQGSKVIAQSSFTVAAGSSTDLVAHRFSDATRAPTFTAFANDLSPVAPGKARLLIAHTAAAPPADVVVNQTPLVRDVANGESSTSVVPSGSYQVEILPTATTGPAILGPKTLTIHAGTLTNVFAIGDAVAGTMDAVVQQLPIATVGAGTPLKVNTGDGGQAAGLFASSDAGRAAAPSGVPVGLVAVLMLGAALGMRIWQRRTPAHLTPRKRMARNGIERNRLAPPRR